MQQKAIQDKRKNDNIGLKNRTINPKNEPTSLTYKVPSGANEQLSTKLSPLPAEEGLPISGGLTK